MNAHFRANGKLLLTAEYFILDGAKGLALPLKYGQSLNASPSPERGVSWKSFDRHASIWFNARFDERLNVLETSDAPTAETLKRLLFCCNIPAVSKQGLLIETHLDYPMKWGLGSSSTLISLLAKLGNADPYDVLEKTFNGSGYDIACAFAKGPLTYQLLNGYRKIEEVPFHPQFAEHLYFIYSGRKQNSREGIARYRSVVRDKQPVIELLSEITDKVIASASIEEFCHYLDVHESVLSQQLKFDPVKPASFPDFPGSVKSLGAWGGDFFLAVSDEDPEMIRTYFSDKNHAVVLPYSAMIL
jgi:mevalonate kinase